MLSTPAADTLGIEGLTADDAAALIGEIGSVILHDPKTIAEHSFLLFCIYYLEQHFDEGIGNFQYSLFDYLNTLPPGQHSLFLLPREHGKSTLISFGFILWCVCYRKKKHIVMVSSVRETSEQFLGNIKSELQGNQRIREDFGDLVGEVAKHRRHWRSSRIQTSNHVIVVASSTGSNVRGLVAALPEDLEADFLGTDERGRPLYRMKSLRPDLVVCDDVVDDKRIVTKNVRDRTWWWFWKNLFSATQAKTGNIIVVGTTLHADDLVCRLFSNDDQTQYWVKVKLPAADPDKPFDENGNPRSCLFPEKWAQIAYNRPIKVKDRVTGETRVAYRSILWWKSKELGPAFGPEFLMRPMDESQKLFSRDEFCHYVVKSPSLDPGLFDTVFHSTGKLLEYLPNDLICVTTMDPAGTDEARMRDNATSDPDYTVIMTTGFSPTTRKFYVVAANRMRCKPSSMMLTLLAHLMMFDRRYGAKYSPRQGENYYGYPFIHLGIGIETVAFQKVLSGLLEEIAHHLGCYPLVMELTRGGRLGKYMRALLPSALVSNGLVMWPYPVPGFITRDLIDCFDEICDYPQAPHDDALDAFVDGMTLLHGFSLQLGRGLDIASAVASLLDGNSSYSTSSDVSEFMRTFGREYAADPMTPAAAREPGTAA